MTEKKADMLLVSALDEVRLLSVFHTNEHLYLG